MNVDVYTDGGEEKPKDQIERVKTAWKGSSWRVDLPIMEKGHHVGHALMGQKAIREKPEIFLRQTDPKIPWMSYRPSWIDATFAPKFVSREGFRWMKRFNGRSVNSLSIFPPEDRWSFRDASWPWGLVGKVFTSSGRTGSAALIDDRIIAMAGHGVPSTDDPSWMRFVSAF